MKKALDAPTATGLIKRCGTCSHGSSHFKIIGKTHLHCQHPSEAVAGPPTGWDTLRNWFDKGCAEWSPRVKGECDVCYGATMIPSNDPNGDVMNTRCPKCNPPLNS
jgi:hypothetical protein